MPAEQGNDAERFAAALDLGRVPGSADAELLENLEIVAMLRSRAAEYAPHPDAKARAKARLMAVLAAEQGDGGPQIPPPSAHEQTAPLGRLVTSGFPTSEQPTTPPRHDIEASAVTAQMSALTDEPPASDTADDDGTDPIGHSAGSYAPASTRAGRRSGRHTMPSRPSRSAGSRRPSRGGLRRRTFVVAAAALVVMLGLGGTGVFASRDALPGDNLYAVKRAAETAGLALTFDEQSKARRHLELAATRLDEAQKLAAAKEPAQAELITNAIHDFDTATGEGSRILLADDEATAQPAQLDDLRSWATEQSNRLTELNTSAPVPAASDSLEFLQRLLGRTKALEARSDCTEITSGVVDDLGPLPAEGVCSPRPDSADQGDGTTSGNGDEKSSSKRSPKSSTTPEDTDSTTPSDEEEPGLLPDLGDLGGQGGEDGGSEEPTTGPPSSGGSQVHIPLPLPLPPIVLPPLLPNQPGITIGGAN
ncbi:DUF5667 domain-containing protein [Pseudonocardia sp. TRM90224]|uniref:DUF5667 domain-containing protein n=1 Tax=Pseudonocardia sp. TRM90224 TaxID=2812678 RepID=UPI001E363B5B|nr:DUF5667 domain-containing protein [Pseudonocardia sp. TRM90224]